MSPVVTGSKRKPLSRAQQIQRMCDLDGISRLCTLSDAESVELEQLLHADNLRRIRASRPIPRGIVHAGAAHG